MHQNSEFLDNITFNTKLIMQTKISPWPFSCSITMLASSCTTSQKYNPNETEFEVGKL